LRYVKSRVNKETQDKAYRIYVTDSFKMITENSARMVNGGKYLKLRYIELIGNAPQEEKRTSEEIIAGIRDKLSKLGG